MIEGDTSRERQPGGPESGSGGVSLTAPVPDASAENEAARAADDSPRANAALLAGDSTSARTPVVSGGAVVPAGGVNTLRAILLGGSSRTPEDARLTAIERRLDTLSLQLAREPRATGEPTAPSVAPSAVPTTSPEDAARLAEIERRLEAHDARLDAAGAAARGSDVTLATLEALRQQIGALREDYAQLVDQTASLLREADIRCQLRQLRVRTARRQELQRHRRWAYAPVGALGAPPSQARPTVPPSSAAVAGAQSEAEAPPPVWPVTPASQPSATPTGPASALSTVTSSSVPLADGKSRHAAMRRDLDLVGARHAVGGSLAALWQSLATLAVVTVRLAGNDLRALWAWLRRSRDQRNGPYSD